MEVRDFIGKVVIEKQSRKRYVLSEITSPYIAAKDVQLNPRGGHSSYIWDTINGDPFTNGELLFEDPALTAPFVAAYTAYCRSKDAYWEEYGYWMRRA